MRSSENSQSDTGGGCRGGHRSAGRPWGHFCRLNLPHLHHSSAWGPLLWLAWPCPVRQYRPPAPTRSGQLPCFSACVVLSYHKQFCQPSARVCSKTWPQSIDVAWLRIFLVSASSPQLFFRSEEFHILHDKPIPGSDTTCIAWAQLHVAHSAVLYKWEQYLSSQKSIIPAR